MKKSLFLSIFFIVTACPGLAQIINWNFEMGRNNGWTEQSQGNYTLIGTGPFFASTEIQPPVIPRSGNWMGRIGGFSYEVNAFGQSIQLPNVSPLYLSFYLQSRSSTTSECAGLWVGAKISFIVNNQLIASQYLCNYNDLHNWTRFFIDVSPIAGQTAALVFKAESANSVWSYLYIDDVTLTGSTTDIKDAAELLDFKLDQNYPNPFNPSTNISFSVEKNSFISLKIYDAMGREVETLVNELLPPGIYTKGFDAKGLSSGVYFYQLRSGNNTIKKKMILLK